MIAATQHLFYPEISKIFRWDQILPAQARSPAAAAPTAIPQAMSIARKAMSAAVQNVVFALVIKVIVMILGLVGIANMWLAVFADSGVALLCVLNSIRILRK